MAGGPPRLWRHQGGGGGASEQEAFPPALDRGGSADQPHLVGAVRGVAQGVDGLQAGATLQAAAVVGEGVEGELAVVHPQTAGPCNAQHTATRGR